MLFPPGIIPLYLVVRSMGLLNTLWSLMLPLGIDAYFCILMRNFYESLPDELFESAEIEGAAEWQVYWRIALPLSKAGLAAITLFYAVLNWNSFFHAMMFISKQDLWPIQIWLQNLINTSYLQGFSSEASGFNEVAPKAVQMAVVMVSMVPILLIYPFLQKHFSKGILLGSVKG
jgi:ABC-type glycerol-3-phosphate transport system permease component